MTWSLTMVVTVKYLVFITHATNRGEGGILALVALVRTRAGRSAHATLVAIGLSLLYLLFPAAPGSKGTVAGFRPPVRPAIAVMSFKSLSPGDDTRWLDTAFAEMLTTELAAGGQMRVIRGEAVAQAMRSLGIRDPSSLGRAELERLHSMVGANYVVVGSYLPNRGKIRLDLRVLQAPGGDTIFSVAEDGPQSGIFELVSATGKKLRGLSASRRSRSGRSRRPRPCGRRAPRPRGSTTRG